MPHPPAPPRPGATNRSGSGCTVVSWLPPNGHGEEDKLISGCALTQARRGGGIDGDTQAATKAHAVVVACLLEGTAIHDGARRRGGPSLRLGGEKADLAQFDAGGGKADTV